MINFKNYKMLKVQLSCTALKKIVYRNIAFSSDVSSYDALRILKKSIPQSIILSYQEEKKVIFIMNDTEKPKKNINGLIDKYWIDGIQYVVALKEKNYEYNSLLVICKYDTSKYELFSSIKPVFSTNKKIIIDELADCWILRK